MSNPRDIALLLDISSAARRIESFTDGMDEEAFRQDSRTHLAGQHPIMVIGEAAKRLSQELRNELSQIPWTAVSRMRDRLIHGYDTVDLEVVWETVQQSIPQLRHAIGERFPDLGAR